MSDLNKPEEYEVFGDEWRAELMKLTKTQLIEVYRTECIKRIASISRSTKEGE